jgi:hypothetical protein
MAVQVDIVDDRLLPGLAEFAAAVWDFPPGDEFLRWRITGPPGSRYYVAHDNGRWLAGIGAQPKTYLNHGEPIDCFETYAWTSLPVEEARGWGSKSMRALMAEGRPIVALGGSAATLAILPRLEFDLLADAPAMNLPISAGFAADIAGVKGMLMRAAIRMSTLVTVPKPGTANGLRMQPLARFDERTMAMPMQLGFQAVYNPNVFDWQVGWAELGTFHALRFIRDKQVLGWLYVRIGEESPGQIVGRLLESKFAPESSAKDRVIMMKSMIAIMAGYGATVARTLTTCPDTNAALVACHFRARAGSPALVYHNNQIAKDQPIRVSVLRADGGAQPLPVDALMM